nr:MAG TPA: hypothetical protein [Caudoviricetes sp.]
MKIILFQFENKGLNYQQSNQNPMNPIYVFG